MSYIPEIPNNSLTENLKKLVQLTQQLNDEYSFYYSSPLSETEIAEIERTNNISLPSSYKEWLMFSNEATICGAIAEFYDIKKIINSPNFVHGDTVIIGSMIGDGEIICFSKSDGVIFTNDHEEIYDEHIWLSLNNAQFCADEICNALSAADSENSEKYIENCNNYKTELQLLDRSFHILFDENPQTLIFGDQFPFIYFMKDYGLDYYAAFSGCSADTEASFETITFLAEKTDELGADTIFAIENSDCTIADAIVENTKEKSQKIAVLDSVQSVSNNQIENGYTYLTAMKNNYDILKEVYDS